MSIIRGNRTICIGDIHGCAIVLRELLDKLDVQPTDTLISLGDVTDKGPDCVGAAKLLMQHNAILVASNHDERYVKFIRKGKSVDEIMPNSKALSKDAIKTEYQKIVNFPEVAEYLCSKVAFYQTEIAGHTITCVHGGIGPDYDLYNLTGKHYNEMLRLRYLDADDTTKMVRMKRVDGKYPDESPTWVPETSNVKEWQEVYDGRYGAVVHGHMIVGKKPRVWADGVKTKWSNMEDSGLINEWDAISVDTGAHKGKRLTALVINEDGTFNFTQVKNEVVYAE